MWYKKVKNEKGRYVDEKNERYMIVGCFRAQSPDGKKNAELGLIQFKNLEDCLEAFKLIPYIEPKTEVKEEEKK